MPAQKLTPARLTQIIVMLLILIAAFTWRTLDNNQGNIIRCVLKTCNVSLNNQEFEIHFDEHDSYIVGDSDNFRVSINNSMINPDLKTKNWVFKKHFESSHILITNKKNGDYVKIIRNEK